MLLGAWPLGCSADGAGMLPLKVHYGALASLGGCVGWHVNQQQ